MTPGALIFDYDGLIVDSERIEADLIIEALAEWGTTITYADFGHLFGSVDADHHWEELISGWCGRTVADLEARIHPAMPSLKETQPLLPGVRELIDAAQAARIPLGLGTGNRLDVLERRLGRHGIFDSFASIVTRADVVNGKPSPDIYFEVARRIEVPATDCLVLEDSVPGCEAALAAGMRVIACPSVVTAHCDFPTGVTRVTSLLEIRL